MSQRASTRRDFLSSTGAAATVCLLGSQARGANERISIAFIGVGNRGKQLLPVALKQPELQVVAVCDVKADARQKAAAIAAAEGHQARQVNDFRDVLADRSIDVVCIATPDHWHAYMTVEACKAGKDVYVEKPLCAGVNEGLAMVEAARKHDRVVEAGTWQRSATHFHEAVEWIRSGKIGQIFHAEAFLLSMKPAEGDGNPPDSAPPADIDWDMWVGPAPMRPYNPARASYGSYRKYWDYGGGIMTDWGVHWMDIVQMALGEAMPTGTVAMGGKYWLQDSRDVPDTLQATFAYPNNVLASFETRSGNDRSLGGEVQGITFYGSDGTLFVNRSGYRVIPRTHSRTPAVDVKAEPISAMVARQWGDFVRCLKSRQRTASDVETCFRSTATCILANAALRSELRVHWDSERFTTLEEPAHKFLVRQYRAPWKLEV
ncbi:MAG: Gfo/Idh/MocA family protein [Planctomycetota bacterium]